MRMESLKSVVAATFFSLSAVWRQRQDTRAPSHGLPGTCPGSVKDPHLSCLLPACLCPRSWGSQGQVCPALPVTPTQLCPRLYLRPSWSSGFGVTGLGPGGLSGWGASGVRLGEPWPGGPRGCSPLPAPPPPAALADFDEPKRSTFVMFGVLTIAVRIHHDRWGYGVYSGPIGTAVLIIATKWVRTMRASGDGDTRPHDACPAGSPFVSGLGASARAQRQGTPGPGPTDRLCRPYSLALDLTQVTPLLCLGFHVWKVAVMGTVQNLLYRLGSKKLG